MNQNDEREVFEARDVSNYLHISMPMVYKLFRRPGFPAIQITDRRYIVRKVDLVEWLGRQANSAV